MRAASSAASHPDVLPVLACVLAGLGLRLWLAGTNSGLTMDSPEYVRIAEALAASGRCPDAYQNHGYSMFIALAQLVLPGRELPGRIVSLVAGLALIAITYALARRTLGRPWALGAALLVAFHPTLAIYSGAIMSEATFLALVYGAILLLARPDLRARVGIAAGALLGVAFWVRPEAALVALVAGVVTFTTGGRRAALALLVAATLVGGAYAGFLRWERGVWTPTPKFASQVEGERAEFTVGLVPRPAPPVRDALRRAGEHAGQVVHVWPWALLALSALGWSRRRALLLAPLAPLAVLPFVAEPADLRLVMVAIPGLAVLGAAGGGRVARRLSSWAAASHALVRVATPATAAGLVLAVGAIGLIHSWSGWAGARATNFDDGPMAELRAAGAWLHAHGAPGALVMDRKSYVPFFAEMPHAQLPDDDITTVITWAQARNARYLIVEEYVAATLRPQLLPLIADRARREAETRLVPVYAARGAPGTGVAIFAVQPAEVVVTTTEP